MKLITEFTEDLVEFKTETRENSEGLSVKDYFIEGIFMQSEVKNRNGRVYEKRVLEKAVDRYIDEQVSKNRAVGELNHPDGPTVNLDKVSHKIESLEWSGNNVIGKARILDTPMGRTVKRLMEGGVKLGVSSRGMGSITKRGDTVYVKDDFVISTVDIVQDPSAHSAFVNGIMEGVEWKPHNDGYIQVPVEQSIEEKTMRTAKFNYGQNVRVISGQYQDNIGKITENRGDKYRVKLSRGAYIWEPFYNLEPVESSVREDRNVKEINTRQEDFIKSFRELMSKI